MKEIYQNEKGGLITKKEWEEKINKKRKEIEEEKTITNEKEAVENLKEKLIKAVAKRTENNKQNNILFSGGVDSTIIAYILKTKNEKIRLYTIGTKNSPDIKYAEKIAEEYNLPLRIRTVTKGEIIEAVKKVKNILKTKNKVEIAIGTTEYLALKLVKEEKQKTVFTGLGSEEIFAGYQRHLKAKEENKDINEECWNGLKTTYERDFIRESKLSEHFQIKEKTPFLDEELIRTAMQISGELKIKNKIKKYVLRKTAEKIGLREEYAYRPKKAAQYGSGINKTVMKILKKQPLTLKKPYQTS